MENLTIEQQIRSEIYRAFELLGAGRELLGTIGSWGDTLDDKEVLTLLKDWNADESRRGKIASNWFSDLEGRRLVLLGVHQLLEFTRPSRRGFPFASMALQARAAN